jgi:mercuric ion transport protein
VSVKAKYAGILSAVLGSICCVGPLLLIALGLGTGAAIIGRYHWIFIGTAIVVLVWAWTKHFREKAQCACEHRAMYGRGMSLLALIVASAVVVAFAALNISSYAFPGSPAPVSQSISSSFQRVVIPVEGMSCATCEVAVRSALKRVNGVEAAHVSVATKNATIDYDPAKTNPEQLVAAINSTGYHATLPHAESGSTSKNAPLHAGANADRNTDQIGFYQVPLGCPLVAGLGCGSAAKPIMKKLESNPAVAKVSLDHSGTILALEWKTNPSKAKRERILADAFQNDAVVNELLGGTREEALTNFNSGAKWYGTNELDELSTQEADAVATQLLDRVSAEVSLTQENRETLRGRFAELFKRSFINRELSPDQVDDELLKAGRVFLDPKGMAALRDAISHLGD